MKDEIWEKISQYRGKEPHENNKYNPYGGKAMEN